MRIVPVLSVVAFLGACGDPLSGIAKLGDVDVAQTDPAAAVVPEADEVARDGFFGTAATEGENAAAEAAIAAAPAAAPKTAKPEMGGFLRGLIKRGVDANPEAVAAATAKAKADAAADLPADAVVIETRPTVSASVELAALPDPAVTPREELGQRKRGIGLFGGGLKKKDAPRTGPDASDVAYGTVLPFGQIARVCDARGKPLGTKVEGTGRRGFALFDSKHGIRDRRTFYITGFEDKCPRQFTAANALLGVPSFYEDLRFGPTGKFLPHAATDKAYDKLKSKVCRAAKNKPCGKNMAKMDSTTVFVSAYEFGEHNKGWKEFLVHNGEVLASARK